MVLYRVYDQCSPISACVSAQSDQGLQCSLEASPIPLQQISLQLRPKTDNLDAQANLDLH